MILSKLLGYKLFHGIMIPIVSGIVIYLIPMDIISYPHDLIPKLWFWTSQCLGPGPPGPGWPPGLLGDWRAHQRFQRFVWSLLQCGPRARGDDGYVGAKNSNDYMVYDITIYNYNVHGVKPTYNSGATLYGVCVCVLWYFVLCSRERCLAGYEFLL